MVRFGQEWLDQQKAAVPAAQHPAYVWRNQAYAFMGRQEKRPDGSFAVTPNGTLAALIAFYYDLYIVDDNSLLDETLLKRLRHRDQFQGALHELFAEATCLRAGFTIIREDERDGSRRHVEFVAVHKSTGQHVLVEAKSRHRAGVMGQPGETRDHDFRFRNLINDAIAKDPKNPLAIFVDTNLPLERANRFYIPRQGRPTLPSEASVVTSNPAMRGHFKTGHRKSCRTTVVITRLGRSEQDYSTQSQRPQGASFPLG